MGIFARKRENGAGAAVQLREGGRHPFGVLDGYVPLSQGEMELYRSIREAVPIVDAALRKLVRLAGSRCPAGRALPRRGWTGSSSM